MGWFVFLNVLWAPGSSQARSSGTPGVTLWSHSELSLRTQGLLPAL